MEREVWLRVNESGRVVIPAAFRKALGIVAGEKVAIRIEDDELRITSARKRLERGQRIVRKYVKPGVSLSDELIAERRREAWRE